MNRSTVAIIAVATLLLGSGVSGLLFVKPEWEEQGKLTRDKAAQASQKASLAAQVATLEAQVKRHAMGEIAYFDLRTSPNQRREMETKTVETLASLTEIFNDNKIDVQILTPKGETQGLNKPVPTPAVSAGPAAGASPGAPAATPTPTGSPSGPPTEAPVQLTHKAFTFSIRGEYPNLVRAMTEIQGLPRAISVNQFDLSLVRAPGAPTPGPDDAPVSESLLQLDFQLSVTYLMAGGLPAQAPGAPPAGAPAPGAPGGAPSAKPISLELLHWAANWLGEPAYAAELATPAKAPVRTRFEVTGVTSAGGDLVVRTRRGVPRYHFSTSASRLVLELEETRLGAAAMLAARVPGVRAVSARPSTTDPNAAVIVVETDGTRFIPVFEGSQLRLRAFALPARPTQPRVAAQPAAAQPAAARPAVAKAVLARPAAAPKPAIHAAFQAADSTAPPFDASHARGQKATKADPIATRRVAPAMRQDTAGAETWSALAERAAAEWASTQGGDPEAFTPPAGAEPEPVKAIVKAAAKPVVRPAAKLVEKGAPKLVEQAAAKPASRLVMRPTGRPAAKPVAAAPAGPATRLRGVDFQNGALVVRTEGPAPTFKVVGGDRRSIVLELDQTQLPGSGRLFAVGQAGVKQVRAALYDNHPPRVRLVVDTDGSVAVHPVMGPDGVLRLRLAERPGLSHEVRLASAATSAIVTTTKENPVTRDPGSVRRPAPARTVTPKPRPIIVVKQPARRVVRGPVAQAAIRRAQARRVKPQLPVVTATRPRPMATPTPMAKPLPKGSPMAKPSSKASPMATPLPMPAASPPGPSLTRSLTSTYSFPIDREKTTGRQNPFKPLARPKSQLERKGGAPAVPGKPSLLSSVLPGLPIPGAGGTTAGLAAPKAPGAAGFKYELGGVLVGGGGPPLALINVDGKAYTVGLNGTLPGNARVTAIKVDHVTLAVDGREIPLDLKR